MPPRAPNKDILSIKKVEGKKARLELAKLEFNSEDTKKDFESVNDRDMEVKLNVDIKLVTANKGKAERETEENL